MALSPGWATERKMAARAAARASGAAVSCYPDALLPAGTQQRRARLSSGVELFWLELAGAGARQDAPTVVFIHGFPELALTWAPQMQACAARGFRCVAPDMRGYGFSDAPASVEAYHMRELCGDLVALLDHLGVQKAAMVGHDWGGFVLWNMVLHHEERLLGGASLNTPLSSWEKLRPAWEAAGCHGPMEYMTKHVASDACGELDYQVYFNVPDVPERELERDVERTINAFFRSQLASASREEHLANMQVGMRTAKARKGGNRGVLHYCPPRLERDPLWSEAEVAVYVAAFQRKGFFGPLGWYRNIDANIAWSLAAGCAPYTASCKKVLIPCLMVTAAYDVVLNPAASEGMERHFARLARGHVACGHWVQKEATREVNRIITDWLGEVLTATPRL